MKRLIIFTQLAILAVSIVPAMASPLFDPFLEKFQVGVFRDPDKIALEGGYPQGLMEPLVADTVWIHAAAKALDPETGPLPGSRTKSLLEACNPDRDKLQSWLKHHHKRLAELEFKELPSNQPYHVGGKFLLADRLAVRVFLAHQAGHYAQAAKLSRRLTEEGQLLGLKPREIFVWDLRTRYLASLSASPPRIKSGIWPTIYDLGSFDSGNAWAIWVARQRSLGEPVLPGGENTENIRPFLGRLRNTWLGAKDLSGAGFSPETLSALGAKILPKDELAAHFKAHPVPPKDLTLQGWWAGGQRRLKLGDALHYEKLAARTDLLPAWRLDIFRRASEIHILAGNWPAGMTDLKEALLLVKNGHGTKSLRRRLRQWNEQAIALASAQGDTLRRNELLALGFAHFADPDLSVYKDQTARWKEREPTYSFTEMAKDLVSRGQSPDFLTGDVKKAELFAATNGYEALELWFQWGREIALQAGGSRGLTAEKLYSRGMESKDTHSQIESTMQIVANRFSDEAIREVLLRMALEYDVGTLCGWSTTPRQSPIPGLVKKSVKGPLGRHALLGMALTTGDMRGILATASLLPNQGMTEAEKQLFLFPLPIKGPIRDAIEAAGSDPALILAVAKNESLFDPAVRSRAGALGFMQIMPFHYDDRGANFGKDHWSQPAVAIAFGDKLLQEGSIRYNGNPYMSLAGYNAGPKPTARWLKQLGGVCTRQEFVSWIGYPETRYYVEKVLLDREIYDSIIASSGNNSEQ